MLDVVVDTQPERQPLEGGETAQRRVAITQLDVLAIADVRVSIGVDADDLAGIRYRQGSQENSVGQAEHRGIDADAQSEDGHGNGREAGCPRQSADTVAK